MNEFLEGLTGLATGMLDFFYYKNEDKMFCGYNNKHYDDVIIKFSKMNLCTEEDMKRFDENPAKHKILLNNRKKTLYSSEVFWAGEGNEKDAI